MRVKLGEQGCLCASSAEPSYEGAAERGVHDSSEGRTWFHHSPAAADYAQSPGDRTPHLWLALHQPGVPQGEAHICATEFSGICSIAV